MCRRLTPFFDVRFRGYGKDKISYLRMLNTLGFRYEPLFMHTVCSWSGHCRRAGFVGEYSTSMVVRL